MLDYANCNERFLIVTADDFGLCPSMNGAIMELFRAGAITSSMIMMPCSYAEQAAFAACGRNEVNVGVHLTLTSSFSGNKWGPVVKDPVVRSLIAQDGYFYERAADVELQATEAAVRAEIRGQIEAAIRLGINPTHLDSHEGSLLGLSGGRDFLEPVFDLCEEYRLPFKLPKKLVDQPFLNPDQRQLFRKRIESAQKRGIALIDDLISLPYHMEPGENYQVVKDKILKAIKGAGGGITEVVIHPSTDTAEIRMITTHWEKRVIEYQIFMDRDINLLLKKEQIRLNSWKHLRDWQRKQSGNSMR